MWDPITTIRISRVWDLLVAHNRWGRVSQAILCHSIRRQRRRWCHHRMGAKRSHRAQEICILKHNSNRDRDQRLNSSISTPPWHLEVVDILNQAMLTSELTPPAALTKCLSPLPLASAQSRSKAPIRCWPPAAQWLQLTSFRTITAW
jgi:hypothetical protein